MSEMVEKAARAAREAVRNTPEGRSIPFEEMSRIAARAVIEAMREPTDSMLTAGGAAILDADEDWKSNACYRAMIDAALSEEAR